MKLHAVGTTINDIRPNIKKAWKGDVSGILDVVSDGHSLFLSDAVKSGREKLLKNRRRDKTSSVQRESIVRVINQADRRGLPLKRIRPEVFSEEENNSPVVFLEAVRVAHGQAEKLEVAVDADKLVWILRYLDFDAIRIEAADKPIVFRKQERLVGLLMPLRYTHPKDA